MFDFLNIHLFTLGQTLCQSRKARIQIFLRLWRPTMLLCIISPTIIMIVMFIHHSPSKTRSNLTHFTIHDTLHSSFLFFSRRFLCTRFFISSIASELVVKYKMERWSGEVKIRLDWIEWSRNVWKCVLEFTFFCETSLLYLIVTNILLRDEFSCEILLSGWRMKLRAFQV